MKPSERIEQIAKEIMAENSTLFNPREAPTTTEYMFAIGEYLDERRWWKKSRGWFRWVFWGGKFRNG